MNDNSSSQIRREKYEAICGMVYELWRDWKCLYIVRRVPMPYTLDCDGMVDDPIVTLYAPLSFSFEGGEAIDHLEISLCGPCNCLCFGLVYNVSMNWSF
jgi:hypothetical protein